MPSSVVPVAVPTVLGIHRIPVPQTEPPYDDELPGAGPLRVAPGQSPLALTFAEPVGPPRPVPDLRLVPPLPVGVDDEGGSRTPRSALPAPGGVAGALVQAVLEVQVGRRPVTQLLRLTSASVYEDLDRAVTLVARRPGRRQLASSRVRSVRVHEYAGAVAEVSAVVQRGDRYRAVALRLEGLDGRWQCTALELG